MENRRTLAEKQLRLMDEVRAKADINLVTCGHCATLLLHKLGETSIVCFGCKREMELCDCPDYWYEGCIENSEFDE
jgi:ATP:corrinoid adenosyltransferase